MCFIVITVAAVSAVETLWDYQLLNHQNEVVPLSQYKNSKALLIVNVASNCGFTYTNYRELEELHEKYSDAGLIVIAVPCNQFGFQEPSSNDEIQTFTQNYGVTFPVMKKADVNGPGALDLFKFLKDQTGQVEINWNFNKFLVTNDGKDVKRYVANVNPSKIEDDLLSYLGIEEEL